MDGRAWLATVHVVAQSRTRLADFPLLHWRQCPQGSCMLGHGPELPYCEAEESASPLCGPSRMDRILFTCSSVGEHLGDFRLLAVVNKAAMNLDGGLPW